MQFIRVIGDMSCEPCEALAEQLERRGASFTFTEKRDAMILNGCTFAYKQTPTLTVNGLVYCGNKHGFFTDEYLDAVLAGQIPEPAEILEE